MNSSTSGIQPNDKLSTPLVILSFCIPIAGVIIYLSNMGNPQKAKTAGIATICSIGIATVLMVIGILTGEIH